nr:hypothetical protein [Streptomyces sp. RLB1-33]
MSVQALVTRGFATAIRESRWIPPVLSEMLAAVTHSVGSRPAEGVDAEVALAACDLLACVDSLTRGRHVRGGLDALGVEHTGTRLGVPAFGLTHQLI